MFFGIPPLFPRPSGRGFKVIMEIKELMLKAFKEGQVTPDATEGIIKLWISGELETSCINKASSGGEDGR